MTRSPVPEHSQERQRWRSGDGKEDKKEIRLLQTICDRHPWIEHRPLITATALWLDGAIAVTSNRDAAMEVRGKDLPGP